jgi:hypothetical protein
MQGPSRDDSSPQGREDTLPLPRGLIGHCRRGWRGRHRAPRRLCRARRHLRGARRHLRGARRHICSSRAPLLWTARWRALLRPPWAPALSPPLRLPVGAWAPTYRGEPVPRRLPPLPPPTTNLLMSPEERVPASRAAETPHFAVPGAHAAGAASPSGAPPSLALVVVPRVHAQARGVGGSDRAASTAATCEEWAKLQITPTPREPTAQEEAEVHSLMGRPGAW